MSQRRFTEKPDLDPTAVRSLPDGHPAMLENRTLFPSTVVEVTATTPDRLLVSGENNIKIGKTVEKGQFKGYAIYCLSLEERATCPADCEVRGFCYGNGMQFGRRHRIGDPGAFFDRLDAEIADLARQHVGVLVRLHVLGDFPSVEYVSFWKDVLDGHDNVACFGYTHRRTLAWGGDEIGDAVQSVKDAHPERFRIRWSGTAARADGATVLETIPDSGRGLDNEIVCPSQTDATACCATCALCWDKNAVKECIGFIKHGPRSNETAAAAEMLAARAVDPEFDVLMLRARPAIRRYAMSLTRNEAAADDLVQDVLVKALRNKRQFEPGTNMGAWLSTIARNEFLSGRRKKSVKSEIGDPEGFMIENAVSQSDTAAAFEAREALAAVADLPDDQRESLLEIASGKQYDVLAEELGVPVGTVKSRVSRGRSTLRDLVENGRDKPREGRAPALPETAAEPTETADRRRVRAIKLPSSIVPAKVSAPPELKLVSPSTLIVEDKYQRELSGKSLKLIKSIVANWDWAKFKPPVCAAASTGMYFVIDGQHTAIAAATHPEVSQIPIMVVYRQDIAARAAAFVSQNRDRLAMSPLQIFHAELAAGDKAALGILRCVVKAGASVPRSPPPKDAAKPGEIVTVTPLQRLWKSRTPEHLERVLRIAVLSAKAPITSTILYGVDIALTMEAGYEDLGSIAGLDDAEIAWTLQKLDVEKQAAEAAAEADIDRYHALAMLVENGVWDNAEEYNAKIAG